MCILPWRTHPESWSQAQELRLDALLITWLNTISRGFLVLLIHPKDILKWFPRIKQHGNRFHWFQYTIWELERYVGDKCTFERQHWPRQCIASKWAIHKHISIHVPIGPEKMRGRPLLKGWQCMLVTHMKYSRSTIHSSVNRLAVWRCLY